MVLTRGGRGSKIQKFRRCHMYMHPPSPPPSPLKKSKRALNLKSTSMNVEALLDKAEEDEALRVAACFDSGDDEACLAAAAEAEAGLSIHKAFNHSLPKGADFMTKEEVLKANPSNNLINAEDLSATPCTYSSPSTSEKKERKHAALFKTFLIDCGLQGSYRVWIACKLKRLLVL